MDLDFDNLLAIGASATALVAGATYIFCKSRSNEGPAKIPTQKVAIGKTTDLEPGKMKEVRVSIPGRPRPVTVLLVHTSRGKWHATGPKCPHANASLAKGVLAGDRVTCPLHAASFNMETGDIEDGPSFDKIPVFPLTIENDGTIFADLPKTDASDPFSRVPPHFCTPNKADPRHFLILGAGPAGFAAAETLRSHGYKGRITMATMESEPPYDRTKMSKNLSVEVSEAYLRSNMHEWLQKHGIVLKQGAEAIAVDAENRTVTFKSGEIISYHKLLCATGGPARTFIKGKSGETFVIPGAEADGIFTLKTGLDAANLNASLEQTLKDGKEIVIVGSSFIGMEAASYIALTHKKGSSVTVVGMEEVPFERVLGKDVGTRLMKLHAARDIKFEMQAVVEEFMSENGKVTGVKLKSGKVIPASTVLIGAGIIPLAGYLQNTKGASLLNKFPGGIVVGEHLNVTEDFNIFSAGDITYFPYKPSPNAEPHPTRIEHWNVAIDQARVAALNMIAASKMQGETPASACGPDALTTYDRVPFFWTNQLAKSLRCAGYGYNVTEVIVQGDGEDKPFVAYYMQGDKVASVATWDCDPQAVAAFELLRLGKLPSKAELLSTTKLDLVQWLAKVDSASE